MISLSNYQKKALDIYHIDGPEKAWNYWKLTGHNYGIFLGEIPSNEFITGDDLANHIGLTGKIPQHNGTSWLKFILDGNIIIIPMKPIMHSVSWGNIYQCGAVYGTDDFGNNPSGGERSQDARITIDGIDYRVTLLKGANNNSVVNKTGYDNSFTHNSEWNSLMYPIHSGIHGNFSNSRHPSYLYNQWASYSDNDLIANCSEGDGSYNWTQETHDFGSNYRLIRGGLGVAYVGRHDVSLIICNVGWRPALRLIQK